MTGRSEWSAPLVAMSIGALVIFLARPLARPIVRWIGAASIAGSALPCVLARDRPCNRCKFRNDRLAARDVIRKTAVQIDPDAIADPQNNGGSLH